MILPNLFLDLPGTFSGVGHVKTGGNRLSFVIKGSSSRETSSLPTVVTSGPASGGNVLAAATPRVGSAGMEERPWQVLWHFKHTAR